jgi:hypothetical protein
MAAYLIIDTAIENSDEYEKYKALAGIGRIITLFPLFHQRKERDSRRRSDSGHTNSA